MTALGRHALLIAATLQVLSVSPAWATDPKPNVLMIVADDLGWADIGAYTDIAAFRKPPVVCPSGMMCREGTACTGDNPTDTCAWHTASTPAIDGLAAAGTRYMSYYTQPTCTPSRVALLTGQYPQKFGIDRAILCNQPLSESLRINQDVGTIAHAFRAGGYRTAHVGKWHVAPCESSGVEDVDGYRPGRMGYDHFTGFFGAGPAMRDRPADGTLTGLKELENGAYVDFSTQSDHLSDALTERAIDYIDAVDPEGDDKPFFITLWYSLPHASPISLDNASEKPNLWDDPDTELVDEGEFGQKGMPEDVKERYPETREGAFGAMVEYLDSQIGDVLAEIDLNHPDTIVLFLSDNGGAWGNHECFDRELERNLERDDPDAMPNPKPTCNENPELICRRDRDCGDTDVCSGSVGPELCNGRLTDHKISYREGGIRVPLIVRVPGDPAFQGVTNNTLIRDIDLLPTLTALAGIELELPAVVEDEGAMGTTTVQKTIAPDGLALDLEAKHIQLPLPAFWGSLGLLPDQAQQPEDIGKFMDWVVRYRGWRMSKEAGSLPQLFLISREACVGDDCETTICEDASCTEVPAPYAACLGGGCIDTRERHDRSVSEPSEEQEQLEILQRWLQCQYAEWRTATGTPDPNYGLCGECNDGADNDGNGLVDTEDTSGCSSVDDPVEDADNDDDGVENAVDNCTDVANPLQTDPNRDGFGVACDGDLDASGTVDAADVAVFDAYAGQAASIFPDADFDENGSIDADDLAILNAMVLQPPAAPPCLSSVQTFTTPIVTWPWFGFTQLVAPNVSPPPAGPPDWSSYVGQRLVYRPGYDPVPGRTYPILAIGTLNDGNPAMAVGASGSPTASPHLPGSSMPVDDTIGYTVLDSSACE